MSGQNQQELQGRPSFIQQEQKKAEQNQLKQQASLEYFDSASQFNQKNNLLFKNNNNVKQFDDFNEPENEFPNNKEGKLEKIQEIKSGEQTFIAQQGVGDKKKSSQQINLVQAQLQQQQQNDKLLQQLELEKDSSVILGNTKNAWPEGEKKNQSSQFMTEKDKGQLKNNQQQEKKSLQQPPDLKNRKIIQQTLQQLEEVDSKKKLSIEQPQQVQQVGISIAGNQGSQENEKQGGQQKVLLADNQDVQSQEIDQSNSKMVSSQAVGKQSKYKSGKKPKEQPKPLKDIKKLQTCIDKIEQEDDIDEQDRRIAEQQKRVKLEQQKQQEEKEKEEKRLEMEAKKKLDVFQQGADDEASLIRYPALQNFLEHKYTSIFVTIITVYALFGDDIRVIATNKHADPYFDAATIFSIVIFVAEICLSVIARSGYLFSFFFWLDIISTVSLFLDITTINKVIFNSSSSNAAQIAKAGKASRVGTRAGRIIRLVRLIRIVKLYKKAQEVQQEKEQKRLEMRAKKKKNKMLKQVHPGGQNPALPQGIVVQTAQENQPLNNSQSGPQPSDLQQNQMSNMDGQPNQQSRGSKQGIQITQDSNFLQNQPLLQENQQQQVLNRIAEISESQKPLSNNPQTQNDQQSSNSQIFQQNEGSENKIGGKSSVGQVALSQMIANSSDQIKRDSLSSQALQQQALLLQGQQPHRPSVFSQQNQQQKQLSAEDSKSKVQLSDQPSIQPSPTHAQPAQLNEEDIKESRVSRRLSDLTTKRVIAIVLLLLFIMPLFSASYFFDPPSSMDFATKQLLNIAYQAVTTKTDMQFLFDTIVAEHASGRARNPIVKLYFPGGLLTNYQADNYDDLRTDELDSGSQSIDLNYLQTQHSSDADFTSAITNIQQLSGDDTNVQGYQNKRVDSVLSSWLQLGRTMYVCIVLTVGALMFTSDANELALGPIEGMIKIVNNIARNPNSSKDQDVVKDTKEQYETTIIQNAIVKIGTLLALGFGDAGSEIIASNMKNSGDVDPMIPGKKGCAIYGFCDIRNFTDTTEILQEQVLIFVNNVGEIVHSMVDRFMGAANKNIGDAFLLVWKLKEKMYELTQRNKIVVIDQMYISTMADFALLSFIKINAKLYREPKILEYRKNERLCKRMPNYKVKLGFGLHIGWGIEGAIGSEFKIDASYLSPNVNMASKLEGSTKIYGVQILITSDLQQYFSDQVKQYTRQIDNFKSKGSNDLFGLYTVDLHLENLPMSKRPEEQEFTKQEKYEIDKEKKEYLESLLKERQWDAQDYITCNKDLNMVLTKFDPLYLPLFEQGFQAYTKGKWNEAQNKLQEVLAKYPTDGPTLAMIELMQTTNFIPPHHWGGYRIL